MQILGKSQENLRTSWLHVLRISEKNPLTTLLKSDFSLWWTLICKSPRLSHNIAGVTILAFGNGAPDIFSSLAGVGNDRPELVFGELFGAGMFVTTVVAGAICLLRPFHLMKRPFLRDLTFYLIAAFWSFCIFYRWGNKYSRSSIYRTPI